MCSNKMRAMCSLPLAYWLTLILAIATTSCVDKFGFGSLFGEGDGYTVNFNIDTPQDIIVTSRAGSGAFDDSRVYDVYLMLFSIPNQGTPTDADCRLEKIFYQDVSGNIQAYDNGDESNGTDSPNHEFSMRGLTITNGKYRVYAIANLRHPSKAYQKSATDFVNKLNEFINNSDKRAEYTVESLKHAYLAADSTIREVPDQASGAGSIMMGVFKSDDQNLQTPEGLCVFETPGSTVDGAVYLSRLDARINFVVKSGSPDIQFTLTNYSVAQVPRFSALYAGEKDYIEVKRVGTENEYVGYHFGDENDTNQIPGNSSDPKTDLRNCFIEDNIIQEVTRNADHSYSFTFYMPENRNKPTATIGAFNERELRQKDASGKNLRYTFSADPESTDDDAQSPLYDRYARRRLWAKANMYSTYVILEGEYSGTLSQEDLKGLRARTANHEISGLTDQQINDMMSGKSTQKVTAHVQYMIHLGDCSSNSVASDTLNNFDVLRNTNYTYEVTVKGINSIYLEAKLGTPENQTGAQGTIIAEDTEDNVLLDSHNETILLKFTRTQFMENVNDVSDLNTFIAYRTYTPFNDLYSRANLNIDPTQDPANAAWLRFALCDRDANGNYKAELKDYGDAANTKLMSIDDLIMSIRDAIYYRARGITDTHSTDYVANINQYVPSGITTNENLFDSQGNLYVTCFVNENFYDEENTDYAGNTVSDNEMASQADTYYKTHDALNTPQKLFAWRMEQPTYQRFLANSTRKIPYSLIHYQQLFRNVYWKYYVNTAPRAFYLLTGASNSKDLRSRTVEPRFVIKQRAIQSPYTNSRLYDNYSLLAGQTIAPLQYGFGIESVDETRYPWWDVEPATKRSSYFTGNITRHSPTSGVANQLTDRNQTFAFARIDNNDDENNNRYDFNNGMYNALNPKIGIWRFFVGQRWSDAVNPQTNGYTNLADVNADHGYVGMRQDTYSEFYFLSNDLRGYGLQYMVFGCLQRNRDINRDGRIDADELQWYLPAMGQLVAVEMATDVYSDNDAYLIKEGREYSKVNGIWRHNDENPLQWWISRETRAGMSKLWQTRFLSSSYRTPWLWAPDKYHIDKYIYFNQTEVNYAYRCVRNLGNIKTTEAQEYKEKGPQNLVTKLSDVGGFTILSTMYMPTAVHIPTPRKDETGDYGQDQFNVDKLYKNIMLAKTLIDTESPAGTYTAKIIGEENSHDNTIQARYASYWQNGIKIEGKRTPCDALNHPTYVTPGNGRADNPLYTDNGGYTNWRTPTASELVLLMNVDEIPPKKILEYVTLTNRQQASAAQFVRKTFDNSTNITSSSITYALRFSKTELNIGWSPSEQKLSRGYGGRATRCVRDITDRELQELAASSASARSRSSRR